MNLCTNCENGSFLLSSRYGTEIGSSKLPTDGERSRGTPPFYLSRDWKPESERKYPASLQGSAKRWSSWLREFCRQSQAEVASKSSNKIHQTWGPSFSQGLYHPTRENLCILWPKYAFPTPLRKCRVKIEQDQLTSPLSPIGQNELGAQEIEGSPEI